jgi:DNA-binding beta-propeller fold protein YncE
MELIKKYLWAVSMFFFTLISCEKEPVSIHFLDFGERKGVYISCEGNYMYGNASLSFYDKIDKVVYNNLFFARNKAPLGDVAQSLKSYGGNLYIVLNNSGKITVIDKRTQQYRGNIRGLVSPRYIHFINEQKAYVSDLYAKRITIFNPSEFVITGSIDVSDGDPASHKHPTEFFVQIGGQVFVSCWSYDNKILVIDPLNDTIITTITVPAQPNKMVVDKLNRLWVLCNGSMGAESVSEDSPALVRIDPETYTIEQIFRWHQRTNHPGDLAINIQRDTLYFISGGLYKMDIHARKLPENSFIDAKIHLFYSMGTDPENGDLYLSDAIDYQQSGVIYRFSKTGIPLDTFRVGINPGDFYFN